MDFVETVKIDDPRLDESFSFIFVFRKGDVVVSRENRALRGQINDGVSCRRASQPSGESSQSEGARRYTKSSFRTRYCKSSMKRTSKKFQSEGSGDRLLALTANFSK